jgi:hypothetical protein
MHGEIDYRGEGQLQRRAYRWTCHHLSAIIRHLARPLPMLRRQKKQRRRLQGLKSSREQIKEAELSVR